MVQETTPRVFLDSNVIFSGFYSLQGAPGQILQLGINGRITIVISRQVLDEVIRNVQRKLPDILEPVIEFLSTTAIEIVVNPETEEVIGNRLYLPPGDAAVLLAATRARPDYFVTGDNHFLKNPELEKTFNLRIITPARLLRILEINNG
jgi:putative PIN family toxin of toxin-antitoxin system